ncbi:MAG: hypothetical protein HQ582_10185 [Planctomycetes bacterium]|nr:hypothetical protein [Planctomycetota bacterium]
MQSSQSGWCQHLRNFVATMEFEHLEKAIEECPSTGTRQFMRDMKDNADSVPPGTGAAAAQMLRGSGAFEEAAMVDLLGDLDVAVLAEHPEKVGMENCRISAGLCRMKIDLCREHGYRECEAAFLRILGGYATECQDWHQAVEFLREASEIYTTLPSDIQAVCARARAMTLNNLELAERALERD